MNPRVYAIEHALRELSQAADELPDDDGRRDAWAALAAQAGADLRALRTMRKGLYERLDNALAVAESRARSLRQRAQQHRDELAVINDQVSRLIGGERGLCRCCGRAHAIEHDDDCPVPDLIALVTPDPFE